MPTSGPSFSPYPFERLRRTSVRDAAFESALARWVAGSQTPKLDALVRAPVRARIAGTGERTRSTSLPSPPLSAVIDPGAGTIVGRGGRGGRGVGDAPTVVATPSARAGVSGGAATVAVTPSAVAIDPNAAFAELRVAGFSIVLAAPAHGIRALAARWLGHLPEFEAPRPLTVIEHALWPLFLATAIADLGISGQVWPLLDEASGHLVAARRTGDARAVLRVAGFDAHDARSFELEVTFEDVRMSVAVLVPSAVELRVPPSTSGSPFALDVPIVLARTAISRAAVAALAVRDVVTVERAFELEIGDVAVPLRAKPNALEAEVVTHYSPRDMALPDDAHVELTVQLGTRRVSVRELSELAPGQIVPLGRPLAGPFDVRVGNQLIGQGELIDIEGELGVRIVSLASE